MSCREFPPSLSELVDGGLPRDARAKLEAHLEACAECRALLADLKRVKAAARALPKMTAPESVWQNVRAGLDAEARHSGDRRSATVIPFAPWRWRGLAGLAAAAVVVLAVTAGMYFMTRPATPLTPAPPAAAHENASAAVQSIEAELELADQHYQNAIDGPRGGGEGRSGNAGPADGRRCCRRTSA